MPHVTIVARFKSIPGLIFAICAVIALILFSYAIAGIWQWRDMQTWRAVPATVLKGGYESISGDDTTTYRAYGTYRYQYEGKTYIGERVAIQGGSDNIGEFQRQLGTFLEQAAQSGEPIEIYVNPSAPANAVVNREWRWGLTLLQALIFFVFATVAAFIFKMSIYEATPRGKHVKPRRAITQSKLKKNWHMFEARRSNQILSNAKRDLYVLWGISIVWSLLTVPVGFLAYDTWRAGEYFWCFVQALFPLLSMVLFGLSIQRTLAWWKFGESPVYLEPYPVHVGGVAAGRIEFKLAYQADTKFIVSLANIYSYEYKSDKEWKRAERVEWEETKSGDTERGLGGTRVNFSFQIPQHLQASDAQKQGNYHYWRLNVQASLPGIDIKRNFDIPVLPPRASSG